jgi:hypothetical protein
MVVNGNFTLFRFKIDFGLLYLLGGLLFGVFIQFKFLGELLDGHLSAVVALG